MKKTIVTTLALGFAWIAQPASAANDNSANVLTCRVLEQATLGQQPALEDTTLTEPIKAIDDQGVGLQFAEIKYTTKDGLFGITAQAIKPVAGQSAGHSDYLPVWVKNLKTGERIAASGNPSGGGLGPNNYVTSISGAFPTSIEVECSMPPK